MKSFKVLVLLSSFFLWHPILQAGKTQDKELLREAKHGHLKGVEQALKKGFLKSPANINYQDKNGQTPLFWAAHNDNLEIVRYLIKAGADVNLRSTSGASPLEIVLSNIVFHGQTNPNSSKIILLLDSNGAEEPRNVSLKKELKRHKAAQKVQAAFRGHKEREKSRTSHKLTLRNETESTVSVRILAKSPTRGKEKHSQKIFVLRLPILLEPGKSWSAVFPDPKDGEILSPCMASEILFTPYQNGKEGPITFRKSINREVPRDTLYHLKF